MEFAVFHASRQSQSEAKMKRILILLAFFQVLDVLQHGDPFLSLFKSLEH